MKKILLTLLLTLTLGLMASAETWNGTISGNLFTPLNSTAPTSITKTISDVDWTCTTDATKTSNQNSDGQQFGNSSTYTSYVTLTTDYFVSPKVVSKVTVKLRSSATDAALTVKVGGVNFKYNNTESKSLKSTTTAGDLEELAFEGSGNGKIEVSVKFTSAKKNVVLTSLAVEYSEGELTEKPTIELNEDNFVFTAGEETLTFEDNEYEGAFNKGTVISWKYNTDVENADLDYLLSTDADNYTHATSYTYNTFDEECLFVKVVSGDNVVEKYLILYPTHCPTPTLSEKDGAEVYVGKVITANANGANKVELYVNEQKVDGDSYTVAGNLGDVLTIKAVNTVKGIDGDINQEKTITVTIAEKTESVFDFASNTYDIAIASSSDQNKYDFGEKTKTEGIVSMHLSGTYRIWNAGNDSNPDTDFRLFKNPTSGDAKDKGNGTMVIEVPKGYYITGIEFGTGSKATNCTVTPGSFSSNKWSAPENGKPNKVKFEATATVTIKSITVHYAKCTAVHSLQHDGVHLTADAEQQIEFNYTLHAVNHNADAEYQVVLTLVDSEGTTHTWECTEHMPAETAQVLADAPVTTALTGSIKTTDFHTIPAGKNTVSVSYGVKGEEMETEAIDDDAIQTGIEGVTVDADTTAEYYNLQGVRVANPTSGLYIRRQGNTATKVMVK